MIDMIAAESPLTPTDGSVGLLLTLLGRLSTRLYTDALRPLGLKPRHLAVLTELRAASCTQQALGERTGTDPTKLVGLLNELELWSLIVRRRDANDRRRHIVEISACGIERLAEVDRLMAATDRRIFGGLEPPQQHVLLELLGRLAESGRVVTTCAAAAAGIDDDENGV